MSAEGADVREPPADECARLPVLPLAGLVASVGFVLWASLTTCFVC